MKNEMTIDQTIAFAFDEIYQTIAFDIEPEEDNCISRETLFAISLDFVEDWFRKNESEFGSDAREYWELLSSDERRDYMTKVFRCEYYEVGGAA